MAAGDVRAEARPPYAALHPQWTSSARVELMSHPEALNRPLVSARYVTEPEVKVTPKAATLPNGDTSE